MALGPSCNALVESNTITGCGYGILCYSTGANPTIRGNAPILEYNDIRGHWYGVAAINGGRPNLGNVDNELPGDDGGNTFLDNGINGEVIDFYNNTPLDQMAQMNFWGTAMAEDVIYHQVDDPSLGLVNFEPVGYVLSVPEMPLATVLKSVSSSPNPFNPRVGIKLVLAHESHVSVVIVDVAGKLVRELHTGDLPGGEHSIFWNGNNRSGHASGSDVYFYRVVAGNESKTGKLMLVR